MAVLRVEPGEQQKDAPCAECGGTMRRVHGFVYADDQPYGVYYLDWCEGPHDSRIAWLTLSLGAWDDDSTAADRSAFAIHWRDEGMALMSEPLVDRPDFLGTFTPRDAALERPDHEQIWHVADHLVTDDPQFGVVQRWLEG